jgi:hypothetical protein
MGVGSGGASSTPGVARLSLSTHRAQPLPLVRASEDLLSRAACERVGPPTEASAKTRSLSIAEGIGV